ncbi:midnolin homolog isoform X1 [Harmonia axyridis]|uniref:midnolin homolog isoform X1 n=1 Tax=Harmonia axyridis TaxID=115357 RepID=UPI001E2794E9|nr:midnolin homolog isoform X1 [Harmonia axyridis]
MENSSQPTTNSVNKGCGPNTRISIHVNPTTGGDFYLTVENDITVDNFKKLVSKRLKVSRDRISLLFRDKQLQNGNLIQNGISDGSRVTLLPNVETGLIAQRPEIGIMQALESLNDTQVNEFLCGKAPLNLSMRLGDQMMLIQLQLSTVSGAKPPATPGTPPPPNPPSLLQASRNLQHTLRKLSTDVFSGRDRGRRESVYSGTFSGALNPALQDTKGRPRRDVATIVHILNDLLCSVPEFRRISRRSGCEESCSTSNDTNNNFEEPSGSGQPANEDQNSRTRGKLEQLRLVMGEKRERRRQRKQKPYSLPSSDSDTVIA